MIDAAIVKKADKANDIFVLFEVLEEMTYVKHHAKKVLFILSAMRHFAKALKEKGYRVYYVAHDDFDNSQTIESEFEKAIVKFNPKKLIITFPGEYRVWKSLSHFLKKQTIESEILKDEKFLTQPKDFKAFASHRKNWLMEYFYRQLRVRFNILMDNDKPIGGAWNFDKENRKKPDNNYRPIRPCYFEPDEMTKAVKKSLTEKMENHPGNMDEFFYAVTKADAKIALDYFIKHNLCHFGDYQDAMLMDEPWMGHSHLSFYLNVGLLHPKTCIDAALSAYEKGGIKINNIEGFIRQILGWREYVRGLYWHQMPNYKNLNALKAKQKLPHWFWDGKTKMVCLSQSISQTLENAYAHHIQRLMVIGNFCLLTGISPKEVSDWYLAVYADAFEWVELPNVIGMILHADGGLMASKPYAAGGNYIHKMSNYCQNCHYQVKEKAGDTACPFNYLYWHFIDKHQHTFNSNYQMRFMIQNWQKQDKSIRQKILKSAKKFLEEMNHAE